MCTRGKDTDAIEKKGWSLEHPVAPPRSLPRASGVFAGIGIDKETEMLVDAKMRNDMTAYDQGSKPEH